MDMRLLVTADGAVQFRTPTGEHVATLSANAVIALTTLAQVPPDVNPIVHQHVQTIVRQLPAVRDELIRVDLVRQMDGGSVTITTAGQRLAMWLLTHWTAWTRYSRHLPADAIAPWRWEVAYRGGHVDHL